MLAIAAMAQSPHAEVFKCQVAGKILYQDKPCPGPSAAQQLLAIDPLPAEKKAEAEQRLETWQTDYDRREAVKQAAEKEYLQELMRQKEVQALQRSAKAQEEIARAAKKPVIISPLPVYIPYGPGFRRFTPHPKPPHPDKPEPPRRQAFAPKTPAGLK